MIGHRFAGVRGAFAAGAGFISVPFFVMVVMALLYLQFGAQPLVNKALSGMFAVVVGMMLANAWKMGGAVPRRWRPWACAHCPGHPFRCRANGRRSTDC